MKYILKDFQQEAVSETLKKLQRARKLYDEEKVPVTLSLSATTGSGKTVIAAAVLESLFFGSDEFSIEGDPDAIILWVTDDPSLNEQTWWRFIESSELIDMSRLSIIGDGFDQETFDPWKIYFLNRQKLSKSSNFVKVKDKRTYTLWQTIQNTINDSSRHLYMVLDEAHRGLGEVSSASDENTRNTIVSQLVDGHDGASPMPIVWGLSATIDKFSSAMGSRKNREELKGVVIDPSDVQASGLLKDTITLRIPDEAGTFDAVLLKEATNTLRLSTSQWDNYCKNQQLEKILKPLLVVQVPNKSSDEDLFSLCEQICENLPGLDPKESFAHVFGEHQDIVVGGGKYFINYIFPQRVQDTKSIQVLFAKEAVSTGWDCPRAEVLLSLRPVQDKTYITQLIGRMVRTPLARRIEGNDVLNSVACFLPKFNKQTTQEVARYLTGDLAGDDSISQIPDRKVLTSPVTLVWDDSLGDDIKDTFKNLPTLLTPRLAGSQVDRLLNLAGKLAITNIDIEADAEIKEYLCDLLDSDKIRFKKEYQKAYEEVFLARIIITSANRVTGDIVTEYSTIDADKTIIEDGFKATGRAIGQEMATNYLKHIVIAQGENVDYLTAQAEVAAIALVPEIIEDLDKNCDACANMLFDKYRDKIYGLSDEDRDAFDEVRRQSTEPQQFQIVVPQTEMVNSKVLIGENSDLLPTRMQHVLSDSETKLTPINLNELETFVLDTELAKEDTVAWYRNPSGASKSAVQVPWSNGDRKRSMQPDFIFFSRMSDGTVKPSIVDPHGIHLADALGKLRGLAKYAGQFGFEYKRIEALADVDGKVKFIDLQDEATRDDIIDKNYESAEAVYRKLGRDYD